MKLTEKLTELEFTEESDSQGVVYSALGADERSRVFVNESDGIIQVVQMPHDPEETAVIVQWSRSCNALMNLLDEWVWRK